MYPVQISGQFLLSEYRVSSSQIFSLTLGFQGINKDN